MKELIKTVYFKWGVTIFATLAAVGILLMILIRATSIVAAMKALMGILAPFLYGVVIAYLLRPVYNACRRGMEKLCQHMRIRSPKKVTIISRVVSILVSLTLFFTVIVALIMMVIPQLVTSIYELVKNLPHYSNQIMDWINNLQYINDEWKEIITDNADTLMEKVNDWVDSTIMPYLRQVALKISAGLVDAASTVFNIFIGVIVCVYILLSKTTFAAQGKKAAFAVFEKDTANSLIRGARFIDKVFTGFVTGNLIDSIIVGLITFVFMSVFGWHYAILISALVGVTNLIPFFGPFIGAIPSAVLLFSERPMEALYFIIFILVLQQIDGNILKPKIYSQSVNLPSFWTLFAILVGGGLFGVIGMILGVPIFTVIYSFITWGLDRRLRKKQMPQDTEQYREVEVYDVAKEELVYFSNQDSETRRREKQKQRARVQISPHIAVIRKIKHKEKETETDDSNE